MAPRGETPSVRALKSAIPLLRRAVDRLRDINAVLQSPPLTQLLGRYQRHAEILESQIIPLAAAARSERAIRDIQNELVQWEEDYAISPLEDLNAELRSRALADVVALTSRVGDAIGKADFDEEYEAVHALMHPE